MEEKREGGRKGGRQGRETHTKEVQPDVLFVLYLVRLDDECQLPYPRIFIFLY